MKLPCSRNTGSFYFGLILIKIFLDEYIQIEYKPLLLILLRGIKKMNTISGMNSDSEYEYIEFSKSHINYLKKVAQKRVPKEITKMFNDKFNSSSTKKELKEVMAEYNISYKRKNKISDWTEEQKQFLIQIAPFHTFIECAKLLNDRFHISRTPKAILHVADALKITTKECRVDNWTEEKLDFIRKSAPHNTLTKCVDKFNKHFSTSYSRGTIRNKCNMLGIQCITKTHRSKRISARKWTN